MLSARASGTATLLPDGRVLLTGGYRGEGRDAQASAEVLDPSRSRRRYVDTGPGSVRAAVQDRTGRWPDSRTGGSSFSAAGSDVYDPATDMISRVDETATPRRAFVSASVLGPGLVLLAAATTTGLPPTAAARGRPPDAVAVRHMHDFALLEALMAPK
jgi:hypothetical protein